MDYKLTLKSFKVAAFKVEFEQSTLIKLAEICVILSKYFWYVEM